MQAVGPGRELLYLTQTSDDTAFELPAATRLVDGMFIAVLSARDLERSQEFYASAFAAAGGLRSVDVPLEAVNRELGLPLERRHPISAFQLAGRSLVEIDGHPEELAGERAPDDDLPPGLAIVSFEHAELDSVSAVLAGVPLARPEQPYGGRRAALVLGPDGERIELVERAP
jgi:catechol 2,3-dioxygenase-like lactoylglutathione lyase family enzyme